MEIEQSKNGTALYCRLSRDDGEEGESNSIRNQKEMLLEYARENGYENCRLYIDDGASGANFDRPYFLKMIEDAKNGLIKTIIVKDLSRFGRNHSQVVFYTEILFPKYGIWFIAINNNVDGNIGENDTAQFVNIFNEWFVRDTSRKIRAVKKYQGNKGEHLCANPPFGYVKDPNDPKKWIVDEEAAAVVRRIYQLCLGNYGPKQIARMLTEEKILTPSAYGIAHGRHPTKVSQDKYTWETKSVVCILGQDAYTGCTTNFKTRKVSYKDKRVVHNPPEEFVTFENTQEAIIDKNTWERVQAIRQSRHRLTKLGKVSIFSGLVFCGDCGSKLYYETGRNFNEKQNRFLCSGARKAVNRCSAHYIRECVLYDLVLRHLRQTLASAQKDEPRFLKMLGAAAADTQKKEMAARQRELEMAEARVKELDKLFQKIYEDNVNGKISDEQFHRLSELYTVEQRELNVQILAMRKEQEQRKDRNVNLNGFMELVHKYTRVTELNATILNEFIERILVYAPEKVDGKCVQHIEIRYNFIGEIPEKGKTAVA